MSTNAKKVYYVLKYRGTTGREYYVSQGGPDGYIGSRLLSHAVRFGNIALLLSSGAAKWHGTGSVDMFPGFIVRVEETPAVNELRIVSKTAIDPRKPVVFFDKASKTFIGRKEGANPLFLFSGLSLNDPNVVVFSDVEDAISGLAKAYAYAGAKYPGAPVNIQGHMYQVALFGNTATITETVLQ